MQTDNCTRCGKPRDHANHKGIAKCAYVASAPARTGRNEITTQGTPGASFMLNSATVVDGKPVHYQITFDWHVMHVMARKAAASKGKRSQDGPVTVRVIDAPAMPAGVPARRLEYDHVAATSELRNIFASPFCACARAKRMGGELLCSGCMGMLSPRLRDAIAEIESAGALMSFYRDGVKMLQEAGRVPK